MVKIYRDETNYSVVIEGVVESGNPTRFTPSITGGDWLKIYDHALLKEQVDKLHYSRLIDFLGNDFSTPTLALLYLQDVFTPFSRAGSSSNSNEYFIVDTSIISDEYITLSQLPSSTRVILNGIELSEGATRDYRVQGSNIVFNDTSCMEAGDKIKVNYQL